MLLGERQLGVRGVQGDEAHPRLATAAVPTTPLLQAVVGVFDMTAASTGASERTLKRMGIPYKKVGWWAGCLAVWRVGQAKSLQRGCRWHAGPRA